MRVTEMRDIIHPTEAQLRVFFSISALLKFAKKWELEEIVADFEEVPEDSVGGYFYHHDACPFQFLMLLPAHYEETTVWHESLHCAIIMWGQAGAELDVERNQEVLTYTQGHIAQVVRNMYERKEEIENGNSN